MFNCSAFVFSRDKTLKMSREKAEVVGEWVSLVRDPVKKLAPSNSCENDSKTMEEVIAQVLRHPNMLKL